ncbi:tripartite motif-containing protein 29-like [Genypterus blacodes]|uniref:tripartite motif-containing protein 29-like n=1 Tax=Genypterus blacodes TaxID=154954 RepID=UPI003F77260E
MVAANKSWSSELQSHIHYRSERTKGKEEFDVGCDFWDGEEEKKIPSCPQCRQIFTPRPVLVRNTLIADLVEELKKTEVQAAPADPCYAGPADVGCDFCTGRKMKAIKSCLQCLASFCQQHLQPHYDSPTFKIHKLVDPSKNLQENICSHHDEVMKMFCRTDQQCICYLCSVDEHKGHDTDSAAAERKERQRGLGESQQEVQQRIQDREKDVKVLQQEVKAINHSADEAVRDSEEIFSQLICLIEKRSSEVKQHIRSQQKTEVSRAEELQEKLEQEITELRRKDAALQQLSHTEDHIQFLQSYPSLPDLSESTQSLDHNAGLLAREEGKKKSFKMDTFVSLGDFQSLLKDLDRNQSATVKMGATNKC